jgi:hypothetical protein
MRATDYFVRFDRRRERYRVTFAGWLVAAITALMALAASVALLRAVDRPLRPAPVDGDAGVASAPAMAPTLQATAATPAPERPIEWPVWPETAGGAVRYRAPAAVAALAAADFGAAGAWWLANVRSPETLSAGLAAYYSGPLLAAMRQAVTAMQAAGTVRLIYDQAPLPAGMAAVEVTGFSPDGRTAYLTHRQGASHSAAYRLADGGLVPGSQQAAPAVQAAYRLTFDATTRRWKVDALLYAGAGR